jgi:hypothetical protein
MRKYDYVMLSENTGNNFFNPLRLITQLRDFSFATLVLESEPKEINPR